MFAAGVVFLELETLKKPKNLYIDMWPMILEERGLNQTMRECLPVMLATEPKDRVGFTEILELIRKII